METLIDNREIRNVNDVPIAPFDIYIIGTGIIPAFHLTREAEAAIRHSNEVLYVDKSFGVEELLSSLCPRLTDLHAASYREGVARLDAYRTMAARVIEAALDHPPVTFALYGHPLVYAMPPFFVIHAAELLHLRTKVLPGISSLDTMFADLKFDPCTQGVQMYEATDLLLRRRPIQPDVPCFIWQIGTVESRLYSESQSKPNRFARIKEYLLSFYPPTTRMLAVYSPSLPLVSPTISEFTLDTIEERANDLHQGVTVFIPPIRIRPVEDEDILKSMDDVVFLEQMTQEIPRPSTGN